MQCAPTKDNENDRSKKLMVIFCEQPQPILELWFYS